MVKWSTVKSLLVGGLEGLFILKQEYTLHLQRRLILEKLASSKFAEVNVKRKSENEFHISSKISFGVVISCNWPYIFQPIAVTAFVHGDDETKISFVSEIRVELVVIGLAWLLVIAWIVALGFSNLSWRPEALVAFGILPLAWLWFRFVYRVQEEQLITSVLKQFKQS